jgi:hypothetical protein
MDTTELTRAFRDATEDLEPPPGFTAAVVRGGRRRKVRNRVVIATAAAVVTAIAGSGTYVLWPDPAPDSQVATDPRLTRPTGGDLAGDRTFLNDATSAWRQGLTDHLAANLRGQPHVYWAGTTPAGRAAVVTQRFFQASGGLPPGDPDRDALAIGLVAIDPADGKLKVVCASYEPYRNPAFGFGQFQFGPGERTILVVVQDSPVWFSPAPITGPDGRVTRDWQPMRDADGVAVATQPDGANPFDARVIASRTRPAADELSHAGIESGREVAGMLWLDSSTTYLKYEKPGVTTRPAVPEVDRRLPWNTDDAKQMRVGDTSVSPPPTKPGDYPMSTFVEGLQRAGMTDFGWKHSGAGGWSVVAGLADGRIAIVGEYAEDDHPSRVYAVLLNRDGSFKGAVAGDQVDPSAMLPVRLRLPDGQGWIVASYGGKLTYRVGADGQWQDAGFNAALLPDGATQVGVSRDGTGGVFDLVR